MKAIFVTGNEDKRREVGEVLGVEVLGASPDVPEIQALDFEAVVRAKALSARGALGFPELPVIVEDSGLVFGAWGGLPGALTKWFLAGVGNEGLLKMLSPFGDRTARAVCSVAVVDETGAVHVFRGEVCGKIADEPRGGGGFGWDPIFVPAGGTETYAQMGTRKHRDSHRARAFREVRKWLERR